jgi:hypothetical protein
VREGVGGRVREGVGGRGEGVGGCGRVREGVVEWEETKLYSETEGLG